MPSQEAEQREALKAAKAAGEDASDMEKAQDFGRLRTMKVQQAVRKEEEEEMRIRLRQAQRKMKGVKLQYTDSGRVTFDDVAGVPGAKVRPCSPSSARHKLHVQSYEAARATPYVTSALAHLTMTSLDTSALREAPAGREDLLARTALLPCAFNASLKAHAGPIT